MSAPVDWSRYRKCPESGCRAELAKPCMSQNYVVKDGNATGASTREVRFAPHRTRKLRTGYGRG